MTKSKNVTGDRLDPRSLAPLLILSIVEYEVFTFSKATVGAAKQDAWLSVIIGAVIANFVIYLFIKLAARFPDLGYFQYLQIIWGKPIGYIITLLYFLFWLAYLSSIFYETLLANKLLFLPQTPTILPLVIFAVSLIWVISYGLAPIIRFFQLMLPFMVIPLLLLALLFINALRFDNFLPFLGEGILPVLKGSFYALGAFQGPEVLLFAAPLFIGIREGVKPAILAFNLTAFFGWSNTVAAIGILGVENIKEAVLPGIDVVNLLELPGFPVERFGLFLTLPWLIAIYTTLAIYLYLFCYNFIELFDLSHRKIIICILTALPVAIAFFLPDETWHEKLRLYLTIVTVPLVYILPVATLLLAVIRKKRGITDEK